MPRYRLSYPAHIYVSIDATDDDARDRLADLLTTIQDGIAIELDGTTSHEAVVYPLTDSDGEVTPTLAMVEDVEDAICHNCGEEFDIKEGDEVNAAGCCSRHCLNRHRGDDCPVGCQYCLDDLLGRARLSQGLDPE